MGQKENKIVGFMGLLLLLVLTAKYETTLVSGEEEPAQASPPPPPPPQKHKNAYATMMYMRGTRDYEFFVAIRVMLRSLAGLHVDADRVVIASKDVPVSWVQAL
ncbi:putative glucuronosyltransferase pgsip7 [Quercus suber]|uniref:Glucuronosyltransferase pgsip7 n=2 Tax=Quercus suber TaxID=58331 RepID=A0AAW0KWC8_QUESU